MASAVNSRSSAVWYARLKTLLILTLRKQKIKRTRHRNRNYMWLRVRDSSATMTYGNADAQLVTGHCAMWNAIARVLVEPTVLGSENGRSAWWGWESASFGEENHEASAQFSSCSGPAGLRPVRGGRTQLAHFVIVGEAGAMFADTSAPHPTVCGAG
jgi:hypothetical protein